MSTNLTSSMTIGFWALIPVFQLFNMTILVTKNQHIWTDSRLWSSFWLVNMGMAKKEIFNTQSKFFCQLDEINKIFVFRAFRDKVCLFLGGGEGICFQCSFLAFFFFSFCHPFLQPVLVPTLLSFLCAAFWLATFSGQGQRVAGK